MTFAPDEWYLALADAEKGSSIGAGRPPLGVMPRWRWLELRRDELLEAVKRATDAGLTAPTPWVRELYELGNEIPREIERARQLSRG